MLKLDPKWDETYETLLQRNLQAEHPRMRERWLALALIASGQPATQVAQTLGRSRQVIAEWVHQFNEQGPEGLTPQWGGHSRTTLTAQELDQLKQVVQEHPRQVGLKTGSWTGKVVAAYIEKQFGKRVHLRTALRYLRKLGFRRKRAGKWFTKADPEAQQEFAQALSQREQRRWGHSVTVYVDQGQIWLDALLRWLWCLKGQPAQVASSSPPKHKKVLFYVAVVRPLGQVIVSVVEWFDQHHSARFLEKIRQKLRGWRIDLVWDRAPWHRGAQAREALASTGIYEHQLPSYSPKMNAAEQWIRWAKETLSYNTCWEERTVLVRSFRGFVASMAHRPEEVLRRCVPDMLGFSCQ